MSQDDPISFLIAALGISESQARHLSQQVNGDAARAVDLWMSQQSNPQPAQPQPQPKPQPKPTAANPNPPTIDASNLAQALLSAGMTPPKVGPQPQLSADDQQLQKVLEESKRTAAADAAGNPVGISKEEQEIQQAIAASMQNQKMDVDSVGMGSDELAMQRALEASISEAGGSEGVSTAMLASNPTFRKRDEGIPVGLKNVGNTCYLNSLLQTYFFIPELRRAVLTFPANDKLSKDAKPSTVEFMRELQKLFALLILSNQKWVDPSPLLKKLLDNTGQPVNIGSQEDVGEFNELFLTRIAEGLSLTSTLSQSKNSADILKNMFQGGAVEYINGFEEDGSPVEVCNDNVVVAHMILPVNEDPCDLHTSLDRSLIDSIEYTTEKGNKITAEKSRWFKRLPTVLMMQENRVQFHQESMTYRKLTTPLRFDTEISMDRYFVQSREQTTDMRKVVTHLRHELAKLTKDISAIKRYKGKSHGLDQALESTIEYLREKSGTDAAEDSSQVNAAIELLAKYYTVESDRLRKLESEEGECQAKITTAYDKFPQDAAYSLFAVWVHAGVAGSGHYWAYMRCGKKRPKPEAAGVDKPEDKKAGDDKKPEDKGKEAETTTTAPETAASEPEWVKFNDLRVTDAHELEVMQQAVGGDGMSTGYFLIYLERGMFERLRESYLPDAEESQLLTSEQIKKEIEEDNAKFLETLEKYTKSQSEDKMSQFFNRVENQQSAAASLDEEAKLSAGERDGRIQSFYAFLHSIDCKDALVNEIVNREYAFLFQQGFETEIGTSVYKKIEDKLGKDVTANALQYKLEQGEIGKTLFAEYRQFRRTAQYYSTALSAFNEYNFDIAFPAIFHADIQDRHVVYPAAHRHNQIAATASLFFKIIAHDIEIKLHQDLGQQALQLLGVIGRYAGIILTKLNAPLLGELRELFVMMQHHRQAATVAPEFWVGLSDCIASLKPRENSLSVPSLPDLQDDDEKWAGVSRSIATQLGKLETNYPAQYAQVMPTRILKASAPSSTTPPANPTTTPTHKNDKDGDVAMTDDLTA